MKARETKLILKKLKKMNNFILLNAVLIVGISIVTIYSATISKGGGFYIKEAIWAGISIVAYFIVTMIDYKKYMKYYKLLYILNILFLIALLVIGDSRLGAKRWISLGPISIQPSEVAKVLVVLTLSAFISIQFKEKTIKFKSFLICAGFIAPVLLLILLQPDLGTTLIICATFGVILFMANLGWGTIIFLITSVLTCGPLAYLFVLKDYQKKRVFTFLNPEADPLNGGWNVRQSIIAIGSGGVNGKGFLGSTQSKLKFLPEAHTDFIMSVYLEERGFIGGIILLSLYALLILQILYVADNTEDKFGKLVCYGIAAIFFFHFVINVGMTMGIMPVTGKPFLLMSYGGTSLLLSFIMLGIVQSVRIHREN